MVLTQKQRRQQLADKLSSLFKLYGQEEVRISLYKLLVDMRAADTADKPKVVSRPRPEELLEYVAAEHKLDPRVLLSNTKARKAVKAKRCLAFILREALGHSYPEIAGFMQPDGKSHTTALHQCRAVQHDPKEQRAARAVLQRFYRHKGIGNEKGQIQ